MADQPMAEHDDAAWIRAYLEEHRATYDRAALRAKLIEGGCPRHAPQPSLLGVLEQGGKSILGGLAGAYAGALLVVR